MGFLNFYYNKKRTSKKCIKSSSNAYPKRSSRSLNPLKCSAVGFLPLTGRFLQVSFSPCTWEAGLAGYDGVPTGSETPGATGQQPVGFCCYQGQWCRIGTLVREDKNGNKYSGDNKQFHKIIMELKNSCGLEML